MRVGQLLCHCIYTCNNNQWKCGRHAFSKEKIGANMYDNLKILKEWWNNLLCLKWWESENTAKIFPSCPLCYHHLENWGHLDYIGVAPGIILTLVTWSFTLICLRGFCYSISVCFSLCLFVKLIWFMEYILSNTDFKDTELYFPF